MGLHSERDQRLADKLERECGPMIVDALRDTAVTEININPDQTVWFDYAGRGMVSVGTIPRANTESILATSAAMLGTVVNAREPILEGEFPLDGSRLEAGMPPIAAGPFLSIRKPASRVFSIDEYARSGAFDPVPDCGGETGRGDGFDLYLREALPGVEGAPFAAAIVAAVRSRRNILVVGGTGSGKTTLVNAILQQMATCTPEDRIVVIQDTNELQVPNRNKVLLRASDEIGIARLLRVSMRLQPNRIVVGEVRGGEAHNLLKAWNSGHPGGAMTLHADSPLRGLDKLVDYICEAPGMESRSTDHIRRGVAQIIGLVVFIEKTSATPSRRISQVATLDGFQDGAFRLHSVNGGLSS
jgi:type IV secretion system protein TrbB